MGDVTYQARKSLGLCVRCGMPSYDGGIYCATHRRMQQDYAERKRTKVDARPEPPRAPYVSNSMPVMPPVPACCPRCRGLIVSQYGETRCLLCGWALHPIYAETVREPYWRKATRPCRNCKQDAILGKSYCQVHLDYMVNYKRSRRRVAG